MKILFDTNVVLDVLLDREPFFDSSAQLMGHAELGKVTGILSATTITTIHYFTVKVLGKELAKEQLKKLSSFFEIAVVNRDVIEDALNDSFSDFEDAVIYHSALRAGAEIITTRDLKGFKSSKIPVYVPMKLLEIFGF